MPDAQQTCEACQRPIPATETAFLHEQRVLCRECHDAAAPVCPYCQRDLPAKPATLSPCPFCQRMIEVRPRQWLFETTLLTREQVAEVERIQEIIKPVAPLGVHERDYLAARERLTQPGVTPSDFDVVKTLFYDLSKRGASPAWLAELHHAEARFFRASGKDPFYLLRRARQNELADLKAQGVNEVRLEGAPRDCAECRKLVGTRLSVEQALERNPAPVKFCPLRRGAQDLRIGGETLHLSKGQRALCELHYEPAVPQHDAADLRAQPGDAAPR